MEAFLAGYNERPRFTATADIVALRVAQAFKSRQVEELGSLRAQMVVTARDETMRGELRGPNRVEYKAALELFVTEVEGKYMEDAGKISRHPEDRKARAAKRMQEDWENATGLTVGNPFRKVTS